MLDPLTQNSRALEKVDEKTAPRQVVVAAKHAYALDFSVLADQSDELAGKHGQEVIIHTILSRPRGAFLSWYCTEVEGSTRRLYNLRTWFTGSIPCSANPVRLP